MLLRYWSGSERKAVPGALDELAKNSSSSPTQLLGRLGQVEEPWRTLRHKLWDALNSIPRPDNSLVVSRITDDLLEESFLAVRAAWNKFDI
jgi:hypothetical protein